MNFAQQLGTQRYEQTEGRCDYRSGYRERQLHTQLTLHVSRDQEGKFSTGCVMPSRGTSHTECGNAVRPVARAMLQQRSLSP